METNVIIRDARIADLPRIVDIYNSTVAGRMVTADLEAVSVESKQQWFSEHTPHSRPLWVIEADGFILGWLSFQSFYGRPAYDCTAEISIYLALESRGMGLGKYLLQKAIDACPQLAIKNLIGFIFGHNKPSLALFKAFHFNEWGLLPGIANLDGEATDLIIVGLHID
ncbi:MAG: GNAT family N-acetyltransferase [Bacillus sp. (in: firmicutes)]